MDIKTLAQQAQDAAISLAALPGSVKDKALGAVAEALIAHKDAIFAANRVDLARSEKEGLAAPLMKRLKFDDKKLATVAAGIRDLIAMDDPVGVTQRATELDTGLALYRVSCPIGVIGVIFESRPDALVQISSLCLKSGNAVLLKGGSEAKETNRALYALIKEAGEAAGAPAGWIQLLETRQDVAEMLRLDAYIDLIIPRGSNAFVRHIMDNSNIPVMGHADGICHVYVDRGADVDMAVDIAVDSKTQYVAVCNAMETLLVHTGIARDYLPRMKEAMEAAGVELVGCEKTRAVIDIPAAVDADWDTEYLSLKLSVKVVDSLDEAIEHINRHGSGHTDSIVTPDEDAARHFLSLVDAANVFWNCSTRFSDGYVFGLGAEVGIATGKLHARGPVGMEGLLIYKYKLLGSGQTITPYSAGEKHYTHIKIDGGLPGMMPIRMIVTDLDGTLLKTDNTISPYTLSILDRCRDRGMRVVLATGRTEKGAERYIEQVRPHAVISNGGALLRYHGQILYRRMLPMAVTDQLIQECLSSPDIGRITVESEAGFYWDSRYFTHEENYLHAISYDFREPMDSAAYKITVEVFNYTTAAALADRFEEAGMTPFAGEDWYQYSHRDANKMYAVKALADHLRIDLSQAAAFGNDYNDIEMLAGCGMGVAVSNAIPEVRQAADHVTASNDEDGTARFLERLLDEGKI